MVEFVSTENLITTVLRDMGLKIVNYPGSGSRLVQLGQSWWRRFFDVERNLCRVETRGPNEEIVTLYYSNLSWEEYFHNIAMELEENGIKVTLEYIGQL